MAGKSSKNSSKNPKATPKKVSRSVTKPKEPSRGKKQNPAAAQKSKNPQLTKKSSKTSSDITNKKTSTLSPKSTLPSSVQKSEKTKKVAKAQSKTSQNILQTDSTSEPTIAPPSAPPTDTPQKTKKTKPLSAAFIAKQKARLLALKDNLLDTMQGVARDSLRSRPEGSESSAFGMHQADAGSDSYDRDFALNILSQEQDSLYEIDEALKRIEFGTYGICEMSGKPIPQERLEALPFTRYTVECQAELEKRNRYQKIRRPSQPLFAPPDENSEESEDEFSDTKE